MFFRSIIFISVSLFILSCLTGCDVNGKSASQVRQEELIAKLNQKKKDREAKDVASVDYSFEQKGEFLQEMNKNLIGMQEKMNVLSEKAIELKDSEVQNIITAMKDEAELVRKNIEESQNAELSFWEESKRILRKNLSGLKETAVKAEKIIESKGNK